MSNLDQDQLQAIAKERAKNIKTQYDLSNLSSMLVKMTVEAALGAEIEEHLGYAKHQESNSANSRNGYSKKNFKRGLVDHAEADITVPRDRDSSFELAIIKKGENRHTAMDDQILALYAKGMSTRDIVSTFKEMYNADISATLVSKVTDAMLEKVIRKTMYIALGINLEGQK